MSTQPETVWLLFGIVQGAERVLHVFSSIGECFARYSDRRWTQDEGESHTWVAGVRGQRDVLVLCEYQVDAMIADRLANRDPVSRCGEYEIVTANPVMQRARCILPEGHANGHRLEWNSHG